MHVRHMAGRSGRLTCVTRTAGEGRSSAGFERPHSATTSRGLGLSLQNEGEDRQRLRVLPDTSRENLERKIQPGSPRMRLLHLTDRLAGRGVDAETHAEDLPRKKTARSLGIHQARSCRSPRSRRRAGLPLPRRCSRPWSTWARTLPLLRLIFDGQAPSTARFHRSVASPPTLRSLRHVGERGRAVGPRAPHLAGKQGKEGAALGKRGAVAIWQRAS